MNANPNTSKTAVMSLACLLLAISAGCNPGNIGTVSGTVTADGKPLPNAIVKFFPRPEGRASMGKTDEDGSYELVYTRDQNGALVGEHMVQITTAVDSGDYGDKIATELVPAKYNLSSELVENVTSGHNEINFELDLSGEVVQGGY